MSPSAKKQREAASPQVKPAPKQMTLLQRGLIALGVAVVLSAILWVSQSQTVQAEESIPVIPADAVVEVLTDTDVEAAEESSDHDSFRSRWSRAYDYLVKGDTDEILADKSEELTDLQKSLEEQRVSQEAEREALQELRAALDTELITVQEKDKLYTKRLVSLNECLVFALGEKVGKKDG